VLRIDHPDVFKPEDEGTDTAHGDAEAGLRDAATTIDATYTTPHEHQGAMEPHTSVALWSDDTLPYSHVPGGSAGITSWGATLFGAARAFRDRHGDDPAPGDAVTAGAPENPAEDAYAMHAFGAHLAEVRVHADTGEVRVPRMLGTFAVGRVVNPPTARSQLIGGMTFGLSMALHEEVVMDAARGAIVPTSRATTSRRTPTSGTSRLTGSTRSTRTSTRWARRASARSASSARPRRSPTRCLRRDWHPRARPTNHAVQAARGGSARVDSPAIQTTAEGSRARSRAAWPDANAPTPRRDG
jgi:hypothetical protein